jgi:hypothetical protein
VKCEILSYKKVKSRCLKMFLFSQYSNGSFCSIAVFLTVHLSPKMFVFINKFQHEYLLLNLLAAP